MITILHNNRCGKSRAALQFLESKGVAFEVRNYLENPLSEVEIEDLLSKLDTSIHNIIRKNEDLWKENFSETTYSDSGSTKFDITFPDANGPFEEITEDWRVLSSSTTKLELKHVSGGDGSIDLLTFEKN